MSSCTVRWKHSCYLECWEHAATFPMPDWVDDRIATALQSDPKWDIDGYVDGLALPCPFARLHQAEELLRELEWAGEAPYGIGAATCPSCNGYHSEGHHPDCHLAAFLSNSR